jgi:tetratricopeptide (TPR) repeat protein
MAWVYFAGAAVEDAGVEGPFALGVGARAMSLGRAYTGLADDANAVYWNPGALGHLERKEISTLYLPLGDASDYAFAAFVDPVAGFGTFGLGVAGLWVGGIPKTDAGDNDLGTISDMQAQFLIAYGRTFWDRLSAGFALKVNYHSLDGHTETGLSVDPGIYYDAGRWLPGLSLGAVLANAWSSPMTLVAEPDIDPAEARLGLAYSRALDSKGDHRLLATLEGHKSEYTRAQLHGGLEYQAYRLASLRAGWDADRLTAGVGLVVWDGTLDYAVIFTADAKLIQVMSLGWRFGNTLGEEMQLRRLELVNQLSHDKAREENQRGLDLMAQGDYPKAVEAFERAASWVEDAPDIAVNLSRARAANSHLQAQRAWLEGQQAYNRKQYFNALAAWRRAAQWDPALPDIQGSLDLARRSLEQSLVVTKVVRREKATQTLFQRGMQYYLDGKREPAVEAWKQVLAKDPAFPQVRELLAKVQAQGEEARKEEVNVEDKRKSENEYAQGLLMYRQRHYNEARDYWKKASVLDPGNADVKRGLERIDAILRALDSK